MPDLDFVRQEIEHMRVRVGRQRPARRLGALEGEVGRASKMARPQSQLAKARDIAVREGWCYFHVQAIIVAIDQYAEAATVTDNTFRIRRTRLAEVGRPRTFPSSTSIECLWGRHAI